MHPPHLPQKPTFSAQDQTQNFGSQPEAYQNQPSISHFSNASGYQASYLSNTPGYQAPYLTNTTGYQRSYHTQGSSYPLHGPSHFNQRAGPGLSVGPPALINPYAPHINYNVLSLPALGSGSQSGFSSRLPPQPNGVGTFGPFACTQPGCFFRGERKDVNVHMMDRHLIVPPGWKDHKRKRRDDGEEIVDEEHEAKVMGSVTVPGTTVVLDTPEAIAAWKAERKKRWPSSKRIEEKGRAQEEAIQRGEILPEGKSRKQKHHRAQDQNGRGRGRGRGRGGRGRGQGRLGSGVSSGANGTREEGQGQDNGWAARAQQRRLNPTEAVPPVQASKSPKANTSSEDPSDTGSDSESDIDPVRDAIPIRPAAVPTKVDVEVAEAIGDSSGTGEKLGPNTGHVNQGRKAPEAQKAPTVNKQGTKPLTKQRQPPRPRQPPRAPYNPFGRTDKDPLLRKLLLPDIRSTVSNLSQAIRFLVANDFLEGVELKPGDAADQRIQVLGPSEVGDAADTKMADAVPESPRGR